MHFVEKQGPAVRCREETFVISISACKRTFHVPEELALEQRL